MRAFWVAAGILTLAGCVADSPSGSDEPLVSPETFSESQAPWVAFYESGCGMCSGAGGLGPHAEHHAFFVLDDARLVLVDFNVRPGAEGFQVEPNVTFDGSLLASWIAEVPRADGEVSVVRVHTARALDDDLPANLRAMWTRPGQPQPATDYGVGFGYQAQDGTITKVSLHGPLHEGDPFEAFATTMARYHVATLDDGAVSGRLT